VLGGSEGGSSFARRMAPRFAARGYAVLGLPYYSPGFGGGREIPSLPGSFVDVPVERLDSARAWLAAQPGVDGDRVGLYGASKGAEYALLGAAHLPWVRAVAAVAAQRRGVGGLGAGVGRGRHAGVVRARRAGAAVRAVRGMQAEFAAAQAEKRAVSLRGPHDRGRRAHPERVAAARIPVERFAGALLVAGGELDDGLAVRRDGARRGRAAAARGAADRAAGVPAGGPRPDGRRLGPRPPPPPTRARPRDLAAAQGRDVGRDPRAVRGRAPAGAASLARSAPPGPRARPAAPAVARGRRGGA
jgi:dienelactone hydrolase